MTRVAGWLIGVALAMTVVGCAAGSPGLVSPTSATTTTAPTAPAGGVLLTEVGFPDRPRFFTNAPAAFSIPAGVQPVGGANLAELINVVFAGGDGPAVYAYLSANLAAMGCTVTASSADSIVWQEGDWDGAFTMTSAQAALSLRLRARGPR